MRKFDHLSTSRFLVPDFRAQHKYKNDVFKVMGPYHRIEITYVGYVATYNSKINLVIFLAPLNLEDYRYGY